MTRPYKFRAKATTGEWVYGNFIHSKRFEGCPNEYRIHNQETGMESDVLPETVGQLTPFRDEKDAEIWEGDIIQKEGFFGSTIKGFVYFNDTIGSWMAKEISDYHMPESDYLSDIIRTGGIKIGSIHDNPYLLQ